MFISQVVIRCAVVVSMVLYIGLWALCLVLLTAPTISGSNVRYLENLLQEDSLGEAECDAIVQDIVRSERNIHVDKTPLLDGRWVSQGCEVRSGPEFILRSLHFSGNLTFNLIVFHYSDASCTQPTYATAATGIISVLAPSWTTANATKAKFVLLKRKIVFYTVEAADDWSPYLNKTCLNTRQKKWRIYHEYNLTGPNCPAFKDHHELQLLKTQSVVSSGRTNRKLYLGDSSTIPRVDILDAPPLFYPALHFAEQRHGCSFCHLIARSTILSPPHLLEEIRLPPYLDGEWVSVGCEPYPLGLFVSRKGTFADLEKIWSMSIRVFSDAACSSPTFQVDLSGSYSKGTSNDKSETVDGASDLDLVLLEATLTVRDNGLRFILERSGCGHGPWLTDVPKKLPQGCEPLGIRLPTTQHSIVKLEIDTEGRPLLHLGQPEKNNRRSTWYRPPLVQCNAFPPLSLPLQQMLTSSSSLSYWALSLPSLCAFAMSTSFL